jgi:hypothetical protein
VLPDRIVRALWRLLRRQVVLSRSDVLPGTNMLPRTGVPRLQNGLRNDLRAADQHLLQDGVR